MRKLNYFFIMAAISTVFLFPSCQSKAERDYDIKCLELDIKKRELDYLKNLYEIRTDLEFKQKKEHIDSLIKKYQIHIIR